MTDPTNNSLALALLDQSIAGQFRGRRIAYVPVCLTDHSGFGLGIAEYGEPGYYPIQGSIYTAKTYDEAYNTANGMNEHIGLAEEEATKILISSMRRSR